MCIACGSPKRETFKAREWMFKSGKEYNFEICCECQSIKLMDQIADFSELYPKDYYSFSTGIDRFYGTKRGQKRISKIRKKFNESKGEIKECPVLGLFRDLNVSYEKRIADIGCGEGDLLYLLTELGFKKTKGFEPYIEKSIRYANCLEIQKKRVDEIGDRFDVIMLNHSFEHMNDPVRVLKKIRELMDGPEANLLIRVPVVNMAWNLFREHWYQLDPPRHLHIFSPTGLSRLLTREGFLVEKIIFDSTEAQILSSEKNFYRFGKKGIKYHTRRLLKFVRRPMIRKTVATWNSHGLGDQAAFLIKKSNENI